MNPPNFRVSSGAFLDHDKASATPKRRRSRPAGVANLQNLQMTLQYQAHAQAQQAENMRLSAT